MKRSHKLLAWIIGVPVTLLIVLAAALVITLSLFDWNKLKPTIDAQASTAIGRPFAINGNLGVQWMRDPQSQGWRAWVPWPHIVARDISIANPAWTKQPQFAHLDALRFSLSPLDLLQHRVRIPTLQLVNPSVDLERDAHGQANWTFDLPQGGTPSAWTVDLGAIGFDAGQIALDDATGRVKIDAHIEPLQQAIPYDQIVAQATADARTQAVSSAGRGAGTTMDKQDAQDQANGTSAQPSSYQFAWSAKGSYQGAPLEGSGRIGAVLALQQSNQPFPLQAKLRIGDTHIALVGTLTDPIHLGALNLHLWLAGSSMAKLYPILGVTLPDTPAYATRGRLTATLGRSGSRFGYHDFRARVGGSDIAGDIDYVTGGARPKLSGKLQATQLRFADLAPLVGGGGSSTTAPPPAASDRVLPTQTFRTDRWKAMDADVTFAAGRIEHGPSLPIQSLSTHLVMDDGTLTLDPLHFGVAGGRVDGMLRLDGSAAPMRGTLKLGVRGLRIEQLSQSFAAMQTSLGEINGDAALDARGNSVATLLGSSSGELKLLMNNGAISRNLLEMAGLNVGNIVLGKLFGDKTVKIDCAASDFVAQDGLFRTRLFVFDTQDALIDVKGTVNFANEKLDLDVVPHTKGIRLFTLRSPLYVRGTLKQPDVGVHAGPLIARGAGALALGVVATPAAALLALVAPSHDTDNVSTCTTVLQQLRH
ncbi:AsmA family protein [Rhodanobacter sp. DHG33]|uniref:AsmA family protein n=1 Tax=Rhodanobacter sp. DHG33 TaxID=2775921 RepID=UPI00177BE0CD|nr:AsmA family protein [Rhodanobacter sp. DHG33]MBD8900067.1 AsmA family protein [Rhodanobacter sp. DHG33]